LEAEEGFHRYELEPTPSRRQSTLDFGIPPPTPVALTQEQQCELLASIVKPADKALLKLLLNQDFQFTLLHQFLAVRKWRVFQTHFHFIQVHKFKMFKRQKCTRLFGVSTWK
jgi:hypothetical protein